MAFGEDGEVVDELVAGLDRVFEEEAVADRVERDVILDPQVVGAVAVRSSGLSHWRNRGRQPA